MLTALAVAFLGGLYVMAQRRRFVRQRHRALRPHRSYPLEPCAAIGKPGPLMEGVEFGKAQLSAAAPSEPNAWSPVRAANRGQGKLIFVNFTASWCITCQVNDRALLSTEA